MAEYKLQTSPFIVPTDDGKLIEEFFGAASINSGDYSVAHMIAPPKWTEPFQTCDFDEITYLIRGKKEIHIENEVVVLHPNQSICIPKGVRVKYSNPFGEECEYVSFCIPAFKMERVRREHVPNKDGL